MKHEPRQTTCMEKQLERGWAGLQVRWNLISGNHQGWANNVRHVDGVSDVSSTRWLIKGTMASACFSVRRKLPLQPWSSCRTIRFFPICPWFLLSYCPSAGAQREWVLVNLCVGPLRGTPGTPEAFHLTQHKFLLVFIARSYGDFSSWHWNPMPGFLVWVWDPLLLREDLLRQDISPNFYLPHVGMGLVPSVSLLLVPVSMWLILYILSCRT